MKKSFLVAGLLTISQGSALTLSPTNLGLAGKDKEYTYGIVAPKSGSPVTAYITMIGVSHSAAESVLSCDMYFNYGIMSESYVIKHQSFYVNLDETARNYFRSSKQDDWSFGTLLGCGTREIKELKEELFYIPVKNPSFSMPYPLRDFVGKLESDKNLQLKISIAPK